MMQTIALPLDVALPQLTELRFGELTCCYEQGNIRYVRLGEVEILRMLYGAVRDQNWETIPYKIEAEKIEFSSAGFAISYTAVYYYQAIHYKASFHIKGNPDNTLSISMQGEAVSSFKRNRIGLCVHHPVRECAGRKVMIEQVNGQRCEGVFPVLVSPHQPFRQIKSIQWTTESGIEAALLFEGDIFEMEDQRNWSDDSFKTYGTPLELPFPVQVAKGAKMAQCITLKVNTTGEAGKRVVNAEIGEEKVSFPRIGYSRSTKPLSNKEINLLRRLPFDHYRVELHFSDGGWETEFRNAAAEAQRLDTSIELVVFFREIESELSRLLNILFHYSVLVHSVLLLHTGQKVTPPAMMESVYTEVKKQYPFIKIGYGTDAYFAELNRNLPVQTPFDFVSFSLNPQVHATDTRSVWENLNSQANMIQTLQTHLPSTPIHVSPITLKKRGNPDATGEVSSSGAAMLSVDERQHSSFAAMWALSCIQNLSRATSLTFFVTAGEGGILPYADQEVFNDELRLSPFYQVMAQIKVFKPLWIVRRSSEGYEKSGVLLLENGNGEQLYFYCPDKI